MNQDALAGRGILQARLRGLGVAQIHIAVDEVVDHLDVILDVEFLQRLLAQIFGDGRYPVTFFNGIARDREIRAVETDQRDVGAVKRGYKGQLATSGSVAKHLACEQRTYGVWNRVVNVQQVEVVEFSHLGHPGGEGEVVRRVVEQRIG